MKKLIILMLLISSNAFAGQVHCCLTVMRNGGNDGYERVNQSQTDDGTTITDVLTCNEPGKLGCEWEGGINPCGIICPIKPDIQLYDDNGRLIECDIMAINMRIMDQIISGILTGRIEVENEVQFFFKCDNFENYSVIEVTILTGKNMI